MKTVDDVKEFGHNSAPSTQVEESAGIAQLVERNLAKVEVASSSLVSRSRFRKNAPARGRFFVCRDAGSCSRHSRATASSWRAWYQCACGMIPTSVSQSEWRGMRSWGRSRVQGSGVGGSRVQWLGICTSVLRVARAERLAKGQHQRCLNRTRAVTFFGPILHVRSTIAR